MHKLMLHPLDRNPEISAFLGHLTLTPDYESALTEYRRLAVAFDLVDRRLSGLDAAIDETAATFMTQEDDDEGAHEAMERFVQLSAEREYLPALRRKIAIRIAHRLSAWGLAARQLVNDEISRRGQALGKRQDEVEPTKQLLRRRYGNSGYGLEGAKLEHFEELTREMATLDPLQARYDEAREILAKIERELQDRFFLERRSDQSGGLAYFLRAVGIDPRERY